MTSGDEIIFSGEFNIPNGAKNYKGFDYKNYLKQQSVYGIVKTNKEKIYVNKTNSNIIYKIQNSIINKSKQIMPKRTLEIFLGILIGKTDGIEEQDIEYFRKSSLAHILSVSGGHTGYIILGLTYLLDKINISKKIKNILIIFTLIFFMFITGLSPSVIRAVIMSSILIVSKIFYRKIDVVNSICIAILCITFFNPFKLFDIGVLLSYGGTIGIILFNRPIKECLDKYYKPKEKRTIYNVILSFLKEFFCVCVSAQIIIFPINIYFFNSINCVFLISNILAGPIFGSVVILGFGSILISYISIEISKIIAFFVNTLIEILIFISKFSTYIPFSNITVISPYFVEIILYFIAILMIRYRIYLSKSNINFTQKKLLNLIKNYKNKLISHKIVKVICIILILNLALKQIPQDLKIFFIDQTTPIMIQKFQSINATNSLITANI